MRGFKTSSYVMRERVTVQPATEPITLADVKAHLRITGSSEDTLLTELIIACRQMLEEWLKRKLITQTLVGWLDFDSVASEWREGSLAEAHFGQPVVQTIQLPWVPAIAVSDISWYGPTDVATVISPTLYRVDVVDQDLPARISLLENAAWPMTSLRNQNSVRFTWTAGYGAASDIPSSIKLALKMLVAQMYSNRGECSADSCMDSCGAKVLIQTYRVLSL